MGRSPLPEEGPFLSGQAHDPTLVLGRLLPGEQHDILGGAVSAGERLDFAVEPRPVGRELGQRHLPLDLQSVHPPHGQNVDRRRRIWRPEHLDQALGTGTDCDQACLAFARAERHDPPTGVQRQDTTHAVGRPDDEGDRRATVWSGHRRRAPTQTLRLVLAAQASVKPPRVAAHQ
jgi:hypothetical protein